jgi:hypothetical protein
MIANESVETVAKFRYVGRILTYQNYIYMEINSKLRLRHACYRSVQNLLSSLLLSRSLNMTMYKPIILPFVLYECETWPLTIKEEHALRVQAGRPRFNSLKGQ